MKKYIASLLFALFCTQMVQSADQNMLALPQNSDQFFVQPQISTLGIPDQNDAEFGVLYQQFACFQFIDGAYHFAGMTAAPVGSAGLNPWQAYDAYPQANYLQESDSSFSQNDSNPVVVDPNLADSVLVSSEIPSEPFIVGSNAHKVYLRFQDDYKKAENALKIYEEKLLSSSEKERTNWEKLAKRKRDEIQRVKGEIDGLVQKEKRIKLEALFDVVREEVMSSAVPQPALSFNPAPNSTEPSSTVGSEDVDRRLAELRANIFQAQKTFRTYISKSMSGKRSAEDRAKFSCRAERKRAEVKKMQEEMESLGATVILPKKKGKK